MTFKYNNVYINETSTVVGPYEHKGPYSNYYDAHYDDLYFNFSIKKSSHIYYGKIYLIYTFT